MYAYMLYLALLLLKDVLHIMYISCVYYGNTLMKNEDYEYNGKNESV